MLRAMAATARFEGRIPLREDYGTGVFRRRIRLRAEGRGAGAAGAVVGELEDDFHHVRVRVEHDGARVDRVSGETFRVPWASCPAAAAALEGLRGLALSPSLRDAARHADPRLQCTHLFDVAALTVTHAARGTRERVYQAAVPDRVDGRARVALAVDGSDRLAWTVRGFEIEEPPPFAGRSLGGGFTAWCETLDPDLAEIAQVLRRATVIGLGRRYDFDRMEHGRMFADLGGTCHTFRPEHIEGARRLHGSVRDFTRSPEALLSAPPESSPPRHDPDPA
jgi:hypothetical protein